MKVIMPCWIINEELTQFTRNAVESIRKSGDVELIIIDNGSPMGGGMLRELADIYIRNKVNLGYAKAVNQGLKLCGHGELVAVANNDIRVSPNWVEVTKEIMQDPLIMSVHFKMLPYSEPFRLGDGLWVKGKERWCTNSFFVMRNLGLFDENFLNSYDDWDLHLRMYRKGFRTAYTNRASYQHHDSFTQKFVQDRDENNKRNREYFIKKHGEEPEALWEQLFPEQMKQDYREGFE